MIGPCGASFRLGRFCAGAPATCAEDEDEEEVDDKDANVGDNERDAAPGDVLPCDSSNEDDDDDDGGDADAAERAEEAEW